MLPKLKQCYYATFFLNLWMSDGVKDVFALVINFLNERWQPQRITIGPFEANETTRVMVKNLTEMLNQYDLKKQIVACVK